MAGRMNEPSPFGITTVDTTSAAGPDPRLQRLYQPSSGFPFDEEEQEFDPWKYWFVIHKRRRLIAAVVTVAVLLTLAFVFSSVPLYTSDTVVMVKPNVPDVLSKRDAMSTVEGIYPENYYKTQETVLQSRTLAEQVVKKLALYRNKAFLGKQVRPIPLSHLTAPTMNALVDRYLSMLRVSIEPGTSLINIAFVTSDPTLSMELANAHARAYQKFGVRLREQANQEVERFLQSRLVDLRTRLEQSELALNAYRREHGIIPGLMSLDGKEAVVLDRIRQLSSDLTAAEVQRIDLEAQVQVIEKGNTSALPAVTNNSTIQNLQALLNKEYVDIASLSKEFKPGYPPLAQLEAQAARTRESMRQEVQRILDGIRSSYQAAVAKENMLRAEMTEQKRKALSLNDAAVKYAMLQREVDANRALTNNVLQKIKDVGLEAESSASNVSVLDPAEVNPVPTSPRTKIDLTIGCALGLIGGLLLAFAVEYLSNTLNSPDEVEKFLQLPNLGVVPEFSESERSREKQLEGPSLPQLTVKSSANNQLVNTFKPYSMVADAYRSIRTGLLLSRAGSPPKLTLFTSATKGEGKTVTAVNTALMLAQVGAKVLLIDSDLRRGCCHKVLGMQPWPGLTELLIGAGSAEQLIQPSDFPNLSVLMSGSKPPNSTELVGSDRMRDMLRELGSKFDFVVLDAPPLIPVSDAMLLSTMVDGVILVVDSSRTPKKQIKAARARLEYAGARIFGFVVNRMHPKSFHYHYYYGDYYQDDSQTG
jgi:capsular exopolysaccharide synthesis family protein